MIPRCGHAPQIERAGLVNRLISQFLRDKLKSIPPGSRPERFLSRRAEPFHRRSFHSKHQHILLHESQ